uniref:Protein phosphatase 1, regulatory (inhibitor) subunit 14Aa n=1 Tax=Oryzias sinensis TaxID=183150 RepID=A0A8C8DHW9_9TELE
DMQLKSHEETPASELAPEHGGHIPKRHARVTVKYNRRELQRRLDVEKWIDESLDRLYGGQEEEMPEEVNIDELLDLPSDRERAQRLQVRRRKVQEQHRGMYELLFCRP